MLIVIDTNVLYSAIAHKSAVPTNAIDIASQVGTIALPLYVVQELDDVVRRKRPERHDETLAFLDGLPFVMLDSVELPEAHYPAIRDPKDRPILATALHHGCEILISGDKDFLSLQLEEIEILTPAEFVAKYAPADLDSASPPSPATLPH